MQPAGQPVGAGFKPALPTKSPTHPFPAEPLNQHHPRPFRTAKGARASEAQRTDNRAGYARGGEGHTNQTTNTPLPRRTAKPTAPTPLSQGERGASERSPEDRQQSGVCPGRRRACQPNHHVRPSPQSIHQSCPIATNNPLSPPRERARVRGNRGRGEPANQTTNTKSQESHPKSQFSHLNTSTSVLQ